MHIPDGYLSPATAGTLYALSVPFWWAAVARVRRALSYRTVPVLALFAAFSFVLMMFNVPLPGGTTGHAVGGTLLAIVLGPWAAVLGISVVLGIQALFFGDGGLIAFGANCFNMGIVLPLVGYFVYRVISASSMATSARRLLGAIVGSYFGIVMASMMAAIEFGIQPALFHTPDGTPLYAPYGLGVALPAMLIGHLAIAGPVEAIVTGGIFAFLQSTHSSLIRADTPSRKEGKLWVLWVGLVTTALATPIGLLASGTAWGEWGAEQLKSLGLDFIPTGIAKFAGWWPAPLPGYGIPRIGAVVGYVLSALIGVAIVTALLWVLGRWLVRLKATSPQGKIKDHRSTGEDFLSRTVAGFTSALQSVVLNESLSRARGVLQRLDPRVKLLATLLLIVVVSLTRRIEMLAAIFILVLVLGLMGRIPLRFFIRRVLLFLPFSAIIALPAIFITPGQPFLHLGSHAVVTSQGIRAAGFLLLRVMDSVSFGLLLVLSTPWNQILLALRWFRMPSVVVDVLGMTYRYIFLLIHTANTAFLARRSRSLGTLSRAENRRWLAKTLASILGKSQHLSEQVYLAMLSRGYQGDVYSLARLKLARLDYLSLALTVVVAAGLVWGTYR